MNHQENDLFTRFRDLPPGLESYRRNGGFSGLKKALSMTPEEVIAEVENARLLGRGGAGFPTGTKWRGILGKKDVYIVCNADEGEPGTFKDRFIMENAPFMLIEGMMIAGYASGGTKGYIYVRGEYPEITEKLAAAVREAEDAGLPGSAGGAGFPFSIEVRKGGGSYVVGDETALLHSLMGYRGTPWKKPPFPTEKGLWDKPTVINNVETLACVSLIMSRGSGWFKGVGAPESPGPKLFCISGMVKEPGVYELPMGTTVQQLLDAAGGVVGDFKAVQIGGTAGPVYGRDALSYHLDYASMRGYGGVLGSGAVVVLNSTVSMAEVLEVEMRFFAEESCGKCFACRYGTRQLTHMANRIAIGEGKEEYLDLILETVDIMNASSFCPFGKSVVLPVRTIMDGFGDEIRSYIRQQNFVREEAL